MANIERLTMIRDYITAHPEQLDMNTWGRKTLCGTVACVAGHALIMFGSADGLTVQWDNEFMDSVFHDNGIHYPIEIAAEMVLGLSIRESGELFRVSPKRSVLDDLDALIAKG